MIKRVQTFLSGIVFLAICVAGSVIDSSIVAALLSLGTALAVAGLIGLLEWVSDYYLPEGR